MRKHLLCGIQAVLVTLVMCFGGAAVAQDDADPSAGSVAPDEPIGSSNGSFTQSIPIQVPPFRGLEPNLAFSYDSSDSNGALGVGWRISGLSRIVRNSPGFGTPRHDASDIFVLDGDELVACTAPGVNTSAPSCSTGGTTTDYYVTEIESYLRIKRTPGNNIWEVWTRNGTKLTYKPLSQWGTYDSGDPDETKRATDYRWLLSEVTDTHSQTVTYAYVCQPAIPDCYVDTIAYNGATIKFHWESRADDPITYATGAGLGNMSFRLKTVEVKLDAQTPSLVRAYALVYGATAGKATKRSRLASIQQFGKDATVDPVTGAVSGGTSLPPMTLVAEDIPGTAGSFNESAWQAGAGSFGAAAEWLTGDFNGDGRTDFAHGKVTSCKIDVQLANSTGNAFAFAQWNVTGCVATAGTVWRVGDFNADGKSDVARLSNASSKLTAHVFISSGTDFAYSKWVNLLGSWPTGVTWLPGDFNGDGKTDLVRSRVNTAANCATQVFVANAGSTAFTLESWATTPSCASAIPTTKNNEVADFNGDGKDDLVRRWYPTSGGPAQMQMRLSTGSVTNGFSYAAWTAGTTAKKTNERWFTGDVNGDSQTDFVKVYPESSKLTFKVYVAAGNKFEEQSWATQVGVSSWLTTASNKWVIGDFNGDSRADLAVTAAALGKVFRSTSDAFVLEDWETGTGIYSAIASAARHGRFQRGRQGRHRRLSRPHQLHCRRARLERALPGPRDRRYQQLRRHYDRGLHAILCLGRHCRHQPAVRRADRLIHCRRRRPHAACDHHLQLWRRGVERRAAAFPRLRDGDRQSASQCR